MIWKAKPNLLNENDSQTFETEQEAISYLEKLTGQMLERDYRRVRKAGKMVTIKGKSDWELIGKLQRVVA